MEFTDKIYIVLKVTFKIGHAQSIFSYIKGETSEETWCNVF